MELQQLERIGRHVRSLEEAYEREQQERTHLEKKYARLKRRFLRLERSHAKLLLETQAVRSPAQRRGRSLRRFVSPNA
jgi:predicted  nucleic acid-binding Zn-ribbon protein